MERQIGNNEQAGQGKQCDNNEKNQSGPNRTKLIYLFKEETNPTEDFQIFDHL